ncbi:nucleotidyltransferase family protein [Pseudomonas gingeri]|uniref:Nucleotidyltransferase family protein n=1 Tax=Pseudomonas gingeri TaxID=117681 RepID=A0A7Y7Y883_9PSED|nr:nucleotidyltransferase family protein [Pseudomonas gingeri]NVZ99903.1 nucleotidyltransferase family protein [Pseudomonas gingeri]NWA16743.1 nucleotidyltransferase family protein [Pseudomonas gingeri]NWA53871.1 nucleotidyltransferase family protein [Pseudomonas gingeri]NWA94103.1 nucleotidyltransferase family protein [Pseudomonas gingeri]NWB01997.1 nucleotidyltransferase family protein [Pseudomonas gingeri]
MADPVAAIILAAGQGSRFRQVAGADQDKLLAPCRGRDGVIRPVLEQVLCSLPHGLGERIVVTTPDRAEVIRLARVHDCRVLLLDSAGMGDSIAAAVAATAGAGGWLVVLGDMPFILPQTFARVLEGMAGDLIRVPVLAGEYGHPVGFGAGFGTALRGLSGDRGAKPLFATARVHPVVVEDPGITWDVDLPSALEFPFSTPDI